LSTDSPVLFVPASDLFCFSLVEINIGSRHAINHEWIRVIEIADQDVPVNIRDHRDIVRVPAVAEPGCVVFRELCVDRFQSTFLWIINRYLHGLSEVGRQ